jgi:hypothetical protein
MRYSATRLWLRRRLWLALAALTAVLWSTVGIFSPSVGQSEESDYYYFRVRFASSCLFLHLRDRTKIGTSYNHETDRVSYRCWGMLARVYA